METQHFRYQNPALEAFLKSSFEKITSKVKLEGQRFGLINQPELIGGHMAPFIEGIHLEHQQLIDKVATELPSASISFQTEEQERFAEKEVRDGQNKSADLKVQQAEINTNAKNTSHPINLLRSILAWFAVTGICLFDGIQTIPVYEIWGFKYFEAVLCGFSFASALEVWAHSFIPLIALGKTLWQQRLITILQSCLIITLFIFMGNVRAEYLSNLANANAGEGIHMHFSAVPFVIISVVLFAIAVVICHFHLPTREEREAIVTYFRVRKQKRSINAVALKLEASLKTIEIQLSELRINRDAIKSYGETREESIINHTKTCYNVWKHENLFHRQDKGKPDCFDEPYPFTFKTNFLNNNQKES